MGVTSTVVVVGFALLFLLGYILMRMQRGGVFVLIAVSCGGYAIMRSTDLN